MIFDEFLELQRNVNSDHVFHDELKFGLSNIFIFEL